MRPELKEKDILNELIKGLKEATVSEQESMNGLIKTLLKMKKDKFTADYEWASGLLIEITKKWPDVMDEKNETLTKFGKHLPAIETPSYKPKMK
jgi:hypothetical protein